MFCLEDFDPAVKTAAAWAIAFIAKHSEDLARHVVDAKGVEYLVACV
jgi:ABC-type enterobactin transport system permease subunit